MSLEHVILVGCAMGLVVAGLSPVPHQTSEESLRGALDAVTRKQRSLSASPQAYRQQNDDGDHGLAFIPAGAGQLETIGDGYQHLNNKQFNRALMDYLQYVTDQPDGPSQSVFRERERTGSSKRAGGAGAARINNKDLARLLLDGYAEDDVAPKDQAQLGDDEYQRTLQMIYDKYRSQLNDDFYGEDELALSKLLNEQEEEAAAQEPRYLPIPMAERRNVNARYPLFNREYKNYWDRSKRMAVAKRSAKPMNKKQATDPKVAQDLGALFGKQSTDPLNHTHEHEHEHEHGHEHAQAEKPAGAKDAAAKDQPARVGGERPIQLRKKSVDWSDYFGIDRRRKKAVYAGRPDTQDRDDQYLLQKYYQIMADNLNPTSAVEAGKDGGEKRDKLQQMDAKLKSMKNMMIEEAVQVGSSNDMDSQQVKDEIMSRLAAAYSLEKLRQALNELSRDAAAHRQLTKNNLTAPADSPPAAAAAPNYKRNHHNNNDDDGVDQLQDIDAERMCPQVDIIERRCKATEALIGDFKQVLHVPCVMYHICDTCEEDECLERFAMEADKICQEEDLDKTPWSRKHCIQAAMMLPRYPPAISSSALCRSDELERCLGYGPALRRSSSSRGSQIFDTR